MGCQFNTPLCKSTRMSKILYITITIYISEFNAKTQIKHSPAASFTALENWEINGNNYYNRQIIHLRVYF